MTGIIGNHPQGQAASGPSGPRGQLAGDRRKQTIIAVAAVVGVVLTWLMLKRSSSASAGATPAGASQGASAQPSGGTDTATQGLQTQIDTLAGLIAGLKPTPVDPGGHVVPSGRRGIFPGGDEKWGAPVTPAVGPSPGGPSTPSKPATPGAPAAPASWHREVLKITGGESWTDVSRLTGLSLDQLRAKFGSLRQLGRGDVLDTGATASGKGSWTHTVGPAGTPGSQGRYGSITSVLAPVGGATSAPAGTHDAKVTQGTVMTVKAGLPGRTPMASKPVHPATHG